MCISTARPPPMVWTSPTDTERQGAETRNPLTERVFLWMFSFIKGAPSALREIASDVAGNRLEQVSERF